MQVPCKSLLLLCCGLDCDQVYRDSRVNVYCTICRQCTVCTGVEYVHKQHKCVSVHYSIYGTVSWYLDKHSEPLFSITYMVQLHVFLGI